MTEKDVLDATEFFAKHLRPYGMEYIQIDDGYEKLPLPVNPESTISDAWLETKDEFPSGHKGIVDKIKGYGMKAGIWSSSAIYNDEWADKNKEYLICDKDGNPLLGDWQKYILDCREESLEKHLRPYMSELSKAGYEYFKIDAIRHLLYDGLHEAVLLGLLTNDEAEHRFRRFLEVGREAIKEDAYWLSSWGILMQMVGLCDACRISQDAMPNWSGMQMQLVESARWFFTQRILFLNDPDHVCVRAPFEWARSVLSMVALTGGLFMLSDALHEYDEKRLDLIRKCIPPLTTITAETGPLQADFAAFTWTKLHGFHVLDEKPFDAEDMSDEEARNIAGRWPTVNDNHPFSSLWSLHLDIDNIGRWTVLGRFATLPLKPSKVEMNALSLDPNTDYLAFDFWKQEYLGCVRGALDCSELKLGHCQIIALRPALEHPQFLSSSRHVSQDAISLKSQRWENGNLALEIEGVCGTTETYWIHAPKGYEVSNVNGLGLTAEVGKSVADTAGGKAIAIQVTFPESEADVAMGKLTISF
ncbi:MAG TPA: alpha-galactosidase [Armatimonadota bacterium]|nr:alpha-galactosidase [Armatimonadota bacterium]